MSRSTANGPEPQLFETRFSTASAAVSAVAFLIAIGLGAAGFMEMTLPVVGTEMDIVTGMAGLMLAAFVGVLALVAAVYMEPGFDS